MRNYRIKCLALSALNLIVGLAIYIFFRHGTYIHDFLPTKLEFIFKEICGCVADNVLNDFLKYYFVDYLWGAALTFSLCSVTAKPTPKSIITVILISFVLGVCFEIAQRFSIVSGTFDFVDICMYAAASLMCAVININLFLRRKI